MAEVPEISYLSNSRDASKRGRKVLPHWELEGGCYAVTFRLGDSLPQNVLKSFLQERDALAETLRTKGELTDVELRSLSRVMNEKVKVILAGHGLWQVLFESA